MELYLGNMKKVKINAKIKPSKLFCVIEFGPGKLLLRFKGNYPFLCVCCTVRCGDVRRSRWSEIFLIAFISF